MLRVENNLNRSGLPNVCFALREVLLSGEANRQKLRLGFFLLASPWELMQKYTTEERLQNKFLQNSEGYSSLHKVFYRLMKRYRSAQIRRTASSVTVASRLLDFSLKLQRSDVYAVKIDLTTTPKYLCSDKEDLQHM